MPTPQNFVLTSGTKLLEGLNRGIRSSKIKNAVQITVNSSTCMAIAELMLGREFRPCTEHSPCSRNASGQRVVADADGRFRSDVRLHSSGQSEGHNLGISFDRKELSDIIKVRRPRTMRASKRRTIKVSLDKLRCPEQSCSTQYGVVTA